MGKSERHVRRSDQWVGGLPFGLGQTKPRHYLEMAKIAWENRDQLAYSWRILNQGVCDGCALGTSGLKDWTINGPHLCLIRLNLLRLNTMPALDEAQLADVALLKQMDGKALRELGRLPYPMVRLRGEQGFRRISWDEAQERIASQIRTIDPRRQAYYVTSRGTTNETYYVVQKTARFLGTNNVDNASRICHSPSGYAMKRGLGIAASSVSYKDWLGTDLLVFFGSNPANNQPVTTKYIYEAKQLGTQVVTVNPYREPGMERYWIPSTPESAIFGTKMTDHFFHPHTGGDIAFINGVMKHLIAMGAVEQAFIDQHSVGFEQLVAALEQQEWALLERASGTTQEEMRRFAELYAGAKSAVFVWSMGITQHKYGVDNVTAIVDLALLRGMIGKEHCGIMPIRGHSGVQGSAEVGCYPDVLPGGVAVGSEGARRFDELWGFEVPREKGQTVVQSLEQCLQGNIDLLYNIGGNFLETLPAPDLVAEAMGKVRLRVHQDIVMNSSMLVEGDEVILLPAATRYETPGGVTETSTERRIIFSPEIPGRRIGEARAEWSILMEIAERAFPDRKALIHFANTQEVRAEIARANPAYEGIETLQRQGDSIQWGGRILCQDWQFATPDGKAHFVPVLPPEMEIPPGMFYLSTRRGKQFNSMVHNETDGLTSGKRNDVFISPQDAQDLGLQDGDPVILMSQVGEFRGRVKVVPIRPRNIQVFWPEGNRLLPAGVVDPISSVPDYNVYVAVKRP